ncbi:hypothetical protein AKJ09_02838 [Labilithrix luteola]|uniref:Uncharacterized protein n=1 Tax=Labilithrix luteola TaxID=1391654 RepID=A0A0K1PSS3_9BACT|nr:hypothetical protein AKJ09_02838 [Labilithrix luteola]
MRLPSCAQKAPRAHLLRVPFRDFPRPRWEVESYERRTIDVPTAVPNTWACPPSRVSRRVSDFMCQSSRAKTCVPTRLTKTSCGESQHSKLQGGTDACRDADQHPSFSKPSGPYSDAIRAHDASRSWRGRCGAGHRESCSVRRERTGDARARCRRERSAAGSRPRRATARTQPPSRLGRRLLALDRDAVRLDSGPLGRPAARRHLERSRLLIARRTLFLRERRMEAGRQRQRAAIGSSPELSGKSTQLRRPRRGLSL